VSVLLRFIASSCANVGSGAVVPAACGALAVPSQRQALRRRCAAAAALGGAATGAAAWAPRQRAAGSRLPGSAQSGRHIAPQQRGAADEHGERQAADQQRHPARRELLIEDFGAGAAHQRGGHLVQILGVGAEQRAIADDIDDARNATADVVDLAQCAAREDVDGRTGDAHAMAHVGRGLLARQRIEVVAAGDALRELPQVLARQQFAQLRLADQDDLQQLLGFGLQVGEQADVLEHLRGEVLRFIDDQHDAPALRVRPQQIAIEHVHQFLGVGRGALVRAQAELLAQRQQELAGTGAD
jgi:hypothetical protein